MQQIIQDLRLAVRGLIKRPSFALIAIVTLALGIGANTAIFSVVDSVLLRSLPLPDSQSLYAVHTGAASFNRFDGPLSYPEYQDVVAQTHSFESIGGWYDSDANLSGGARPERVMLRIVLPSLLPTLKVQPIRGRNFLDEETAKGRDHVALITYSLWQRQFGGAEDAIGKAVRVDNVDFQIVGILPRDFQFQAPVDLWVPLTTTDPGLQVRNSHFLSVIARLRPGATSQSAAADLHAVAKYQSDNFSDMFPPSAGFDFRARPYLDDIVGDVRLPLYILLGAVGFVLLIACGNVANLLLARAAPRQREMALRAALGARRGHLLRQLLTESLLLTIVAGVIGILLAAWGTAALVALSPDSLPRAREISFDWRVLTFTAAIAVITGVVFGLVPAIWSRGTNLTDTLKEGSRGSTSGQGRLRKALVVAEVALSLMLLVGAGLMLRSFSQLRQVNPGFRTDHALTLRVSLPVPDGEISAADGDRFVSFFDRALARIRELPGVTAAGATNMIPLDGNGTDRLIEIEGYVPRDKADMPDAQNRQATPGWFTAMGIPLVRGRLIEPADDGNAPRVVVVNDTFAKRFFPNGDAIGKRIRLGRLTREFAWTTIVGVVGDVRGFALDEPPLPTMYWPVAQIRATPSLAIVVRTQGDPAALTSAVRTSIAEIDPGQPIYDMQTLDRLVAKSLGQRRFTLTLMLLFGVIALVLSAVGIYGVMAFAVTQRTQEIGIRMALGARTIDVLRLILGSGMSLTAIGVSVGLVGAFAITRLMTSLLFGVSPTDAMTFGLVTAGLLLVALLACYIPARRATKVDPLVALRYE
ncbi:MAG TPA: ABC transporter permease [Pyrinomonadaceae bacterium]|jgi:putative ABC transport system permease protein|nr:ABC transporter permease [Pyrinomonadaceae bacterium]